MSRTHLSRIQEEYLECLFELTDGGDCEVGIVSLAEAMGVARSTAVAGVEQLKKRGFASKERYGKIRLTAAGCRRAKALRRSEDVLYAFLTEILGVSPSTARREACRLEHSLSLGTRRRLVQFVKERRHDER